MLGALILYFNKHPATVFLGDTETLIIGTTIVSIALIVLLPNIIDAGLI